MLNAGVRTELARALRSPFVPTVFASLDDGYLRAVWPQLEPSAETAGFLSSALYLAEMAQVAVQEHYEPSFRAEELSARRVDAAALLAVLDVFYYVQPQSLLLCAALAEAWARPRVGGQGRAEPRVTTEMERAHLGTAVNFASPGTPPLPQVADALQVQYAPELYSAVASWPAFAQLIWDDLQHFPAFPSLRRRARALYYYARSSVRFLAQPLEASRSALVVQGLSPEALEYAYTSIEAALPLTATMMIHCSAMRVALGAAEPEQAA
jgi:hypothetical protein